MSARKLSDIEATLVLQHLFDRGQDALTAEDYLNMAIIAQEEGYPEVAREMEKCAVEMEIGE